VHHGFSISKETYRKIEEILLLPEILKSHGWVTLAVDWLGRCHKKGYDYYSGILHKYKPKQPRFLQPGHLIGRILDRLTKGIFKGYDEANICTDKAIALIAKNRTKRFFLFVHYWDTHYPYNPPLKYALPLHSLHRRYDGEIEFVDYEIGRLMDYLKKLRLLEETLIIFTSDHGESINEHKIFHDHHGLYDVTIHVPLILRHSRLSSTRVKNLVSHVDLVPTILEILNLSVDELFDGKSLVPLIEGKIKQLRSAIYVEERYAQRKIAIRTWKYKYIQALNHEGALCKMCNRVHGGINELYNLEKDPMELRNVIDEIPEKAKMFRTKLEKWKRSFVHVEEEKEESVFAKGEEKEILERLRRLGYI